MDNVVRIKIVFGIKLENKLSFINVSGIVDGIKNKGSAAFGKFPLGLNLRIEIIRKIESRHILGNKDVNAFFVSKNAVYVFVELHFLCVSVVGSEYGKFFNFFSFKIGRKNFLGINAFHIGFAGGFIGTLGFLIGIPGKIDFISGNSNVVYPLCSLGKVKFAVSGNIDELRH